MTGHGWPLAALLLLSWPAMSWTQSGMPGLGQPAVERSLLESADLADVYFTDDQRGWAVGDRGVIWHTEDGGRHWRLQNAGVDCRLESVHFVDSKVGWVAGRQTAPYTHNSHGILLKTQDGGRTWSLDRAVVLPGLRQVKFFSAAHGWVLGDTSAVFASGVFTTDDGGRTWSPVAGAGGGWLAGDFVDPQTGAVAGHAHAPVALRRRSVLPARTPELGIRTIRRLRLQGPTTCWLVGDGGLVMTSEDLGESWQSPVGELPATISDIFDLRALAVRGNHCWMAGMPGTRVLHSPDGGRTWQLHPTGQSGPIAALHFADETLGWAVGPLGRILHSADGGRTWQRQHGAGERLAVYGIYGGATAVPLELFVELSANEGYLGRAHIIGRSDLDAARAAAATLPERTHDALVEVGASGADTSWRFPLRDAGLSLPAERLMADFDAVNEGAALDRLTTELVRNLRVWRPDVVFTHGANPRGDDPLGHLINQVVVHAVQQAADPAWSANLAQDAGLEPWEVKKIYTSRPPGEKGEENLTTSHLAPRLGRSLAEHAAPARGLIHSDFETATTLLGFQLTVNRLPQGVGARGFFSGINLSPAGPARRELAPLADHDLEALRKMARRHRDLQAILSRTGEQAGPRLLAQMGDLTGQLPAENAGAVLFHMGQQLHRGGQWPLAAEVFQLLAQRYPDHPLTGPALVWLVHYFTSGEAAWRIDAAGRVNFGRTARSNDERRAPSPLAQVRPVPAPAEPPPENRVRLSPLAEVEAQVGGDRATKAAQIAELLHRLQPTLYEEPVVRFPLAALDRQGENSRQAEKYYLAIRSMRAHDAWWCCAAGERWLLDGGGPPPKSEAICARVKQKPYLDGQLTDVVWRQARSIQLRSKLRDDDQWPAVVRMVYDEEFLYVAIACQRAAAASYQTTADTRPRDADLARHDRVEFYFDLDRDWTTAWKLAIDHRGWTAESCWGDATWNPDWFVASSGDAETWTVEAAAPLNELTSEPPESTTVWALGVQRIVPGVGLQSWTTPAATEVMPEGFGYLKFE